MPTLDWIGKKKVVEHHLSVPYRILERRHEYGAADANGGTIALVETKGERLANQDSVDKLTLVRRWQEAAGRAAGRDFRYFMVFKDKGLQIPGSYVVEEFIGILKKL